MRNLQCAAMSDPRKGMFIEEVGVGVVINGNGGKRSGELSIFVACHVGNDRDCGSHVVDIVVWK